MLDPVGYSYKKTITMGATTAANQQVLVTLTPFDLNYDHLALPLGEDIRFGADADNIYDHSIDTWQRGGTSRFLVRVPVVGTAQITMWYGNSRATRVDNPRKAYDFFDDFEDLTPWRQPAITLLSATAEWEQSNVYEPSVFLYDTNPQILTGLRTVCKMWYTGGWTSAGVGYAEAPHPDGPWQKYYGNPVLGGLGQFVYRNNVFRIGATYYLYASNNDLQIDLYSSPNGVNWSLDAAAVIVRGSAGQWDADHISNTFTVVEAGTVYVFYDAKGPDRVWKIGVASGPNVRTLSKSASNPIISEIGTRGSMGLVKKVGNAYILGCLGSPTGQLPTDLYRYRGASLTGVFYSHPAAAVLTRRTADEGADSDLGQIADPYVCEYGGRTYEIYAASIDGSQQSGGQHIKLVTADMTVEQLAATQESSHATDITKWIAGAGIALSGQTSRGHFLRMAGLTGTETGNSYPGARAMGVSLTAFVLEGNMTFGRLYDGIMFRCSEDQSSFYCITPWSATHFRLTKMVGGTPTYYGLQTVNAITFGTSYSFKLVVGDNGMFTLTINGSALTWNNEDNQMYGGGIGLTSYQQATPGSLDIDNWRVRKYSIDSAVTVGGEIAISGGGVGGRSQIQNSPQVT